jgi:pyruvate,water dikinase
MFGIDPLSGDRSKVLVSVVEGLPDQIVSGNATGTQIVLGRRGHIHAVAGPLPAALSARHRQQLFRLARATRKLFGAPQDMEWLIDPAGTLRLLQSRPITAAALPAERSHPLGPGPVAETFPDALSALERDLWEPPLEDGIREALRISGAVGRRALADRFVIDVGGRVAVDLEALGVVTPRRSFLYRLNPIPSMRRLRAAWRIGRLRGAMPKIAHDLVGEVDAHLAAVPHLSRVGDMQLLTVLRNAQQTLAALHAHEVLAGFFLDQRKSATTGASVALAAVARGRADGLSDEEILASSPVALALLPPRIGGGRELPPVPEAPRLSSGGADDQMALAREALRLRVRWVQELSVVAVETLGERLELRGQLRTARDARDLRLDELIDLVSGLDTAGVPRPPAGDSPPLPARFRLAADGTVVPDVSAAGAGPIGVSPGRVRGEVTHDPRAAAGKVLVVRTLDPALASALPVVSGLVAETGSPLSHLAILAREYRVPAVVGVAGAPDRFGDGDVVVVDGASGTIELLSTASATDPARSTHTDTETAR